MGITQESAHGLWSTRQRQEFSGPEEILRELHTDNHELTGLLRAGHEVCDRRNDVATASLIENRIDETERRSWFLAEVVSGS